MDKICRCCRGQPKKVLERRKCPRCAKTDKDYVGFEREIDYFNFLRETWEKCRKFYQISTGYKKMDYVLTLLFGRPHDRDWMNYAKATKPINHDAAVVLRLVTV